MSTTALLVLLCAALINGNSVQLLNATVGGSATIFCSLSVDPVTIKWFYWQEDSNDMLFHWEEGKTISVDGKYKNRCQAFSTEFSVGNISIKLDNVAVGDDQKTFRAYVSFMDAQSKNQRLEHICKSTLQVSAPYRNLTLTVNATANTATCTAHGGYPAPQVSWVGRNKSSAAQLDLQHDETPLQDPAEKTFSVTSSVSVEKLEEVTCQIYNPRSNQRITETTKVNPRDEYQQRHHYEYFIIPLIMFVVVVCLYKKPCQQQQHQLQQLPLDKSTADSDSEKPVPSTSHEPITPEVAEAEPGPSDAAATTEDTGQNDQRVENHN